MAQGTSAAHPLRTWFDSVDVDKSGRIDVNELHRALALGQLHFSLATVSHMIRLHDRDGTGTITFDEFQNLHQFLVNMNNSFFYFDRDRSGSLSPNEVHEALKYAGFHLDTTAFNTMVKTFDPDRTATLSLAEFIGMTLFLKSASAMFSAFDPQRQGRITLDFNQFIYAAAHCR